MEDMGWMENVLFDPLVGSTIYICTAEEYGSVSTNLSKACVTTSTSSPKYSTNRIPNPWAGRMA
eukprot:CCRYP_016468-RA/>CCRYP_016468-RA protein AED:0.40 eAED:0.40 QI:0/0/0/1/1/1/2/0/63